jgi:DnaJ-class molecular chaperone
MASGDDMKDCPRCEGRGKYADPRKGPLVRMTCALCDGGGRVPADTPDEPAADEPTQIPFGTGPA